MKRFGVTAALLAALALGTTAGCATGGGSDAGPAVQDAAITAGVRTAVAADDALRAADIDVETSEGIVRLSGFVRSAEDVATAAAAARTVKGVQSVRNDLRLR
jgi:osmotically-inducible protein OsmY